MRAQRLAFFDIGTNTILLLIAAVRADGGFEVLDDLAEITRLGQGVDGTLQITAEAQRRSLEVLRRYEKRCRELGTDEIVAVGTSALRDATNSAEVRDRFKQHLGLEVRVLSGDEEASYSFLAVQKGLHVAGKELLVIDVGGGSTELIHGDASGIRRAVSLNLGAVRLTERFVRSDPVTEAEYGRMLKHMAEEVRRLREGWPEDLGSLSLVGIAGTFTTLAAVEKGLIQYSHGEVHGSLLTLAEVARQITIYRQKSVAERRLIPGLEPMRADVILAGASLVKIIMEAFRVRQLVVSDQGIRYGLLYERLEHMGGC